MAGIELYVDSLKLLELLKEELSRATSARLEDDIYSEAFTVGKVAGLGFASKIIRGLSEEQWK